MSSEKTSWLFYEKVKVSPGNTFQMQVSFLQDGIYVDDLKKVSLRYLKSIWFVVDVVSLLPSDVLYAILTYNAMYRMPRLIKVLKVILMCFSSQLMNTYASFTRKLFKNRWKSHKLSFISNFVNHFCVLWTF